MPTVRFRGAEVVCDRGDTLRDVLLDAGLSPHNGRADALNCRGHGSCGTCAVRVAGAVSEPTRRERVRLRVPPHDPDAGLRLSCQTAVLGDVTVEKFPGFWGQHVGRDPVGDAAADSDGDTAGADRTVGDPDG
ncbi:2Fe-2S iron-sulfur cluster-binding protein [Halobaculum sp. EA56]|uniref:2Fe-2S iron-sulfur cluster-binding protein n=1 Tax=Halobaculum sp. EA56 TaxID=3421648 RepID=UPI003EC06D39